MKIWCNRVGVKSVKTLKERTGWKSIRINNSKFKGNGDKVVLNWGCSEVNKEVMKCKVINHPDAVKTASNKLYFFKAMVDEVRVPAFTTDKGKAYEWINEGKKVVVREKLSGNSGEGIVILHNIAEWDGYDHSKAKMYVLYIPKKDEYRVHVMNGEVIDVQRKALQHGWENPTWEIRNRANGFIFAREGIEPDEDVLLQAISAVRVCGLHFGAVDVIWNAYRKKAYVLEVNTAPGLEGQTVDAYIKGLSEMEEAPDFPDVKWKVKEFVPILEPDEEEIVELFEGVENNFPEAP